MFAPLTREIEQGSGMAPEVAESRPDSVRSREDELVPV